MTHNEVKFRLAAGRPRGQDDADPAMQPAGAEAARDAVLQRWWQQERAFDAAMSDQLRAVTPPAGLRESILAGAQVSQAARVSGWAFWRQPVSWGLAAAITMLLVLATWSWRAGSGGEDALASPESLLRLAQADLGPGFDPTTTLPPAGEIRRWLESPENRLGAGMPFDVAELRRGGCRVIKTSGCEVFQICFERGARYHVYVVPRERLQGMRPEELPILRQQGQLGLASWADGHYVYVLASSAGLDAVRSLL